MHAHFTCSAVMSVLYIVNYNTIISLYHNTLHEIARIFAGTKLLWFTGYIIIIIIICELAEGVSHCMAAIAKLEFCMHCTFFLFAQKLYISPTNYFW